MGSTLRRPLAAAVIAWFGFVCWVIGHVQGQFQGQRDALDSDPEPTQLLCGELITFTSDDGTVLEMAFCERPAHHSGRCNTPVPPNVVALNGG